MLLVVGLGNPGRQYLGSRHNVGFMAIVSLVDRCNLLSNMNPKFNTELAIGFFKEHKLLLAKPMTYMNLSGNAVQSICSYYRIKTKDIVVIHDDVDLEIGRVKFKLGGSSGGHNGLKSIDQNLGNDYYRIRVGIGRPNNKNIDIADYVLGKFTLNEQSTILNSIKVIEDNFELLVSNQLEKFKEKISCSKDSWKVSLDYNSYLKPM